MDSIPPHNLKAPWANFDAAFYRARYAAALPDPHATDAALEAYYRTSGGALGHSPNLFFAETWYRAAYKDVADAIAAGAYPSAFAHYVTAGFLDRSPHWLFSDRYYLACHPDLTRTRLQEAGFVNAYDHFLSAGDREFRSPSLFFDPQMFAAARPGEDFSQTGPFTTFLREDATAGSTTRLSWYFDPEWYLNTYPEAASDISAGRYSCALEHFLFNPTPLHFDPSPYFSEEFYASVHVDIIAAIDSKQFRNGYDHFIQFGVFECRKPHPEIDLAAYHRAVEVQADLQNGSHRDVFAHYVAHARANARRTPQRAISEHVTRELFSARARHRRPLFARKKLDFSHDAPPAISVIVVMYNQLDLTLTALDSLRRNFPGAIELILADSGSTDESRHVERFVAGAKIVRFNHNAGFVEACNAALTHVTAPVTLYMNNDILLEHGAIESAISRLARDEKIGAVGGKIIRTNGGLQEAGCIIWRDGGTEGYFRDGDPNAPEVNFVRPVDFCSGVFLAVRTDLLKERGGFDPAFRPAYFEETDLCIALQNHGYQIIYDPAIMVIHQEYSSSDSTIANHMMAQNQPKFRRKNRAFLKTRYPANPDLVIHARSPRGTAKRILFIEDRIPLRHLGSGFTRSNDIIATMAAIGHQVTVFPIYRPVENLLNIFGDFPDTAEIIHDRELPDLQNFLEQRSGFYDIVWIARTHNAKRLRDIIEAAARHLPARRIVLDTEAIAAPRDHARLLHRGQKPETTLKTAIETELRPAELAEKIIAVNQQDAAIIRAAGYPNVAILGHAAPPRPTKKTFAARQGLLFLGAIHDADSPNLDGLHWFISQVLPILDPLLPEGADITIAGYVNRRIELSGLGQASRVILAGPVENLAPLYDRHRLFFAPTRFAGGIPFKLHEAASHGLPIVTSDLLATQLGWTSEVELLSASTENPAAFAAQLVRLYTQEPLWQSLRESALARLAAENSFAVYRRQLDTILKDISP